MWKSKVRVPVILLLAATSCVASRTTISPGPDRANDIDPQKILILQYTIAGGDTGYTVRLTGRSWSTGRLKGEPRRADRPEEGDLEYRLLDGNSQVTGRGWIDDPLRRSVESTGPEGDLFSKEIMLDSAAFFIRLQADPGARSIIIERYSGEEGGNTFLVSHSLSTEAAETEDGQN